MDKLLLNKYKIQRSYFDRGYHVKDDCGQSFIIEVIPLACLNNNKQEEEYLNNNLVCMGTMNQAHFARLYEKVLNQESMYLIMDYFEDDLLSYQAKQQKRVFTLQKAALILAQVIIGLQELHQQGYLHWQLKSQNVIVNSKNGKESIKLKNYGSRKLNRQSQRTYCPQLFVDTKHDEGVDVWALGVLFYFMLNMQFCFKFDSYLEDNKKYDQLVKLSANFSYSKSVNKSKKKLTPNCTRDIQDLFGRIFVADPKKRIKLKQLKSHPIFYPHFANRRQQMPKMSARREVKVNQFVKNEQDKGIQQWSQEQQIIKRQMQRLDFYYHTLSQFEHKCDILMTHQRIMLQYDLLRYYIILFKSFRNTLNKQHLNQLYPKYKWNQFVSTKKFKQLFKNVNRNLDQKCIQYDELHQQFQPYKQDIEQINAYFVANLSYEIEQVLSGSCKDSYDSSIRYVHKVLLDTLKNKVYSENKKIIYLITKLLIVSVFEKIFENSTNNKNIFGPYLSQMKQTQQNINYIGLKEWVQNANEQMLKKMTKSIIEIYF